MATTATRTEREEPSTRATRMESTPTAVSGAADAMVGAATDAAARLPDVVATTRAAFEDANRRMQAATDEMLTVGTALSFGFAAGLLIGGASRLLVASAMVPVAMMGLTLLDRSGGRASGGRPKGAGGL